jgi:Spy/CpxP family protein refolding chaperone
MTHRFIVAAALAIGLGALPALAQGPGQRMGGPGGGRGGPLFLPGGGIRLLLQSLDLSDQQREQLRAIIQDNRPPDPGQLRDAELKLNAAIFGDTTDPQAIDSVKATINAARAAELDHQIEVLTKVAQILTPEQRQELLKLESEGPQLGRGRK